MKANQDLLSKGYIIINSSDSHITYEQPKKFNWGWFFFWSVLTPFIGTIGYLLYYMAKKGKQATEYKK